uniref:PKD domain-containing protein n=1 Tax=Flavobacterium sp. TaxID=239 RepID=UPI00404B3D27
MFSQTYTMNNGANGTISTCSGTFVDDGGAGNYANNQNSTITFCPSTPGDLIQVVFTSFDTEGGGGLCTDYLDVWYSNAVGPGVSDDRLCGALGSATLISTSPDGCISFQFISNNNVRRSGWSATISCVTPCVTPIAGMVDTSPFNICPSTAANPGSLTVNFDGSTSTAPGGFSISSYEWSWGDGTSTTTATPTTSHTFPGPGIYSVNLSVRNNNTDIDPLGCQSTNAVTRIIRVLPPPDFTGSTLSTFNVNCGDTVNLNGLVTSQTMSTNPLSVSGSPITLPDGSGVNYNTTLDFTGLFPTGSTITPGCYPVITFDIEHSWTRDLQLTLISPSGQSVMIFDQHGSIFGTNFGVCANPADNGVPGCPATYTVVNSGGVNWTAAGVTTVPPLNGTCSYTGLCETGDGNFISQTYNSTNPFSSLDGADMNGVWTLRVRDNITFDDGTITGWSLAFPGSCYANAEFVTPDIASLTWSTSGAGPAVPTQTTTSTVVVDPGPGGCPTPGTCLGNQLTNNVSVGPFLSSGSFTYTLTAVDEFGCSYVRNVTVNVAAVCPTAAISYTGSPFCLSSAPVSVNLTGTGSYTSGVFSAPVGLTINSATGEITPATSTPGTYTITYTIAPNSCCAVPTVTTTSVTISAAPVLNTLTSNSPICSGANAVFNITGTPNSTVSYNINGGGTLTVPINAGGTATVTVPAVTANTTFNALSIAASGTPVTSNGLSATGGVNPSNAAGVISASGTAANGTNCAYVDNTNSTLTITLQNTVPAGTTITISIARDTNAGAVTINDGTANIGTFNAGPNDVVQYINVTTTVATNTIVITRTGGIVWVDGVQYTFTPTGCTSTISNSTTVIVNPLNTIAAGTSQTVCINSAITNITLATTGATGATFSGLPAGVTGSWSGNVVTISGTPTVSGVFNYTVTTTGGCPPATATGTITVTPLNTIAAGTSQTVCINSAITNITLATTGATGATFSGLPAGVTGSWSSDVVTISGTPTVSGVFNYTVTTTGGCPPATATGTITVTPLNTIAAGTSQSVCINSAITNITLATTGATGATFSGLPAGVTGSWSSDVVTISGTPTVSGVFNYTVTTTGGCPPATASGTITVTPLNTIAAGTSQSVCINSAITNITLATTGATGATFSGLPAGVTGSWSGNV